MSCELSEVALLTEVRRKMGGGISRRAALTALAASIAFFCEGQLATAGDDVDETLKKLSGDYRFSGGAKERKALNDAIDEVVSKMNPIVRPFARKRLKQANKIPERVKISRKGNKLTIKLDGRTYTATINGKSVKVRGITGDALQLSYSVGDGKIKQKFVGDTGGRTNVFRNHDDKHARIRVRVFSDKLPKDLVYKLTYRRK